MGRIANLIAVLPSQSKGNESAAAETDLGRVSGFSRKLDLLYSPENLLNLPGARLEWKLKLNQLTKLCV